MIRVRETFEYDLDVDSLNTDKDIFTINDYVDCVDGMICPFWDGYVSPENLSREIEVIKQ